MKINEIINEALGRRDFLKGAGAAAGLGTLGLQAYKQKQGSMTDPGASYSRDPANKPTTAQNSGDMATTQPAQEPVASAPKRVIPKYSPGSVNSPEFAKKLRHIGALLQVNPDDLLKVMYFETNGTLDPSIQNNIGATGLIQFLPKTATALNTTVDQLKKMSATEQLDYVYHYYKDKVKPGMRTAEIYLTTLLPVALKFPENTIIGRKNDKSIIRYSNIQRHKMYIKNPVFDIQKKGYYTVADIKSVINSRRAPTLETLANSQLWQNNK